MPPEVSVTGLVWYRRGDYPRILEVMEDASELHDTFDEWLRTAEDMERKLIEAGVRVVRAPLRPETFKDWCDREGKGCDGKARAEWASKFAQKVG